MSDDKRLDDAMATLVRIEKKIDKVISEQTEMKVDQARLEGETRMKNKVFSTLVSIVVGVIGYFANKH